MKYSLLASILALAIIAVVPQQVFAARRNADKSWYVGLGAMVNTEDFGDETGDDSSISFGGFNGVIGFRPSAFMSQWLALRIEGEYAQRLGGLQVGGQYQGDTLTFHSFMANAYLDFQLTNNLTPFIGGGYGMTQATIDDVPTLGISSDDSNNMVSTYQWMAGLSYVPDAWPSTDWSVTYNYFNVEDGLEFEDTFNLYELTGGEAHSVNVGLRYFF